MGKERPWLFSQTWYLLPESSAPDPSIYSYVLGNLSRPGDASINPWLILNGW